MKNSESFLAFAALAEISPETVVHALDFAWRSAHQEFSGAGVPDRTAYLCYDLEAEEGDDLFVYSVSGNANETALRCEFFSEPKRIYDEEENGKVYAFASFANVSFEAAVRALGESDSEYPEKETVKAAYEIVFKEEHIRSVFSGLKNGVEKHLRKAYPEYPEKLLSAVPGEPDSGICSVPAALLESEGVSTIRYSECVVLSAEPAEDLEEEIAENGEFAYEFSAMARTGTGEPMERVRAYFVSSYSPEQIRRLRGSKIAMETIGSENGVSVVSEVSFYGSYSGRSFETVEKRSYEVDFGGSSYGSRNEIPL